MNDFEFAQALISLDNLIKSDRVREAEIFFEEIKQKLDLPLDDEKLTRLESYREKILQARERQSGKDEVNYSQNELIQLVIKEQRLQFHVMKDILWYLKFFFWVLVISLILAVLLALLS
ncbi:MAG: hypothetical protein HWE07_05055 [Cytophagia bacterium]|nr:hypothetical protein [Cytophagia bacterium]